MHELCIKIQVLPHVRIFLNVIYQTCFFSILFQNVPRSRCQKKLSAKLCLFSIFFQDILPNHLEIDILFLNVLLNSQTN